MPSLVKLWLLIIAMWHVYQLARPVGKVVRLQHRGPLYQKRETGLGLSSDSIALLYGISQVKVFACYCIQLWLASVSFNVILGRGSEKAFEEDLGARNALPFSAFIVFCLLN